MLLIKLQILVPAVLQDSTTLVSTIYRYTFPTQTATTPLHTTIKYNKHIT